jgi:hypothetical protein
VAGPRTGLAVTSTCGKRRRNVSPASAATSDRPRGAVLQWRYVIDVDVGGCSQALRTSHMGVELLDKRQATLILRLVLDAHGRLQNRAFV